MSSLVSHRTRVVRTAIVAAVWTLGIVPVMIGQRCTIAKLTHHPCPGCGLTRAGFALLHGDFRESLTMHPLLVPVLIAQLALVTTTLVATLRSGAPWDVWNSRVGRAALWLAAAVMVAMFVLWGLREFGLFGGPVPV
jgi:Protein of unknown function (DUF2752)